MAGYPKLELLDITREFEFGEDMRCRRTESDSRRALQHFRTVLINRARLLGPTDELTMEVRAFPRCSLIRMGATHPAHSSKWFISHAETCEEMWAETCERGTDENFWILASSTKNPIFGYSLPLSFPAGLYQDCRHLPQVHACMSECVHE